MDRLKELKEQREKISKEISELNRIREKELIREYQDLVGTCYLYHNSMGGGDNFLSYLKILGVESVWMMVDEPSVNVIGIQVDDHKDIYSIQRERNSFNIWKPNKISPARFEKAYNKVLKKINSI